MPSDGDKLRELRKSLGLTTNQVAKNIHVSNRTIARFEQNSDDVTTIKSRIKIYSFLGQDTWKQPEYIFDIHALNQKIKHKFTCGRKYSIRGKEKDTFKECEADCVFIYLRKEGRHHLFMAEGGGWTRTYTDAQLIGKHIKEVTNE